MNIKDVENIAERVVDRRIQENVMQFERSISIMMTEQRKEYERYVGAVSEQFRSEMKMGFEVVNARIDGLEERFDGLEYRFDRLENRFDGLEERFDTLEEKVDYMQEMIAQNTEDIADLKAA